MTESTPQPVATYEVDGHVAVIAFNRLDAMNAVNSELSDTVGNYIEQANAEDNVRVIVLTGNGRTFCAGADLKEIAQGKSVFSEEHPEWGFAGVAQHWSDKPIIAAVHGFALGGGFEAAISCDLIIAAEGTKFGLPEVKRGLVAAAGGVVRTPRQIPLRRAAELVLTGEPISAETALDWGLINRIVPGESLLEEAKKLAASIAANGPLAVKQSKLSLHQATSAGNDWNAEWSNIDPWKANQEAWDLIFASADAREGATAFAEKREPKWTGK
ncbi:enoyl-CoA hydratase-related protein [Corynebacterium aquatimens]|uniref:Probable enoyl-CoA hydratase EchA17 n=1 Tax=Corynebacterium aquatimens TaxID=1190508 RepID=A0A931E1P5_9CORY|nr:enoyl-CoA hydratase-related protein [Corynebacterium aquatimens]MBG6122151.1 crotonobetainyl-CoA hydratase [Corynebacterium aquatimens]WJY65308.1 Carnitinyl-CoA dehydratase [Corynebacterium aquatimens]